MLGVGGNVSQGIQKALACAAVPHRLLAGCIDPLSAGLYLADRAFVTPRADDPGFLPWLEGVCTDEGVDAVLSGSEPVLEALAEHAGRLREDTGAVCLVSAPDVLEVGADKLTTARWLSEHGLRAPITAEATDAQAVRDLVSECGFPVVAKPRRGKGAEGVATLATEEELALVTGRRGLVVQEHLESEEFTVGCVSDSDGRLQGSVVMRRELRAGTTVRAEVGDFPQVRAYAERVAEELRPKGPLNVQLRLVGGAPVAFELNVRFSGTTPMRTRLGFAEVEACLRHFVLGEPLKLGEARNGTVLRYWNELYLPPAGAQGAIVEDWGMRR